MTALTHGQVRALQTNLNERLHARGRKGVKVDGKYGHATAQAVHAVKYLLGFPTSSLDTGPSWWLRHLAGPPGLRPPTYLVRAAKREKILKAERAAGRTGLNHSGDFGVDYAWGTPVIAQLTKAGVRFVCRYLSHDASKNLRRNEAVSLSKQGISQVVVWESTANRALGGYSAGRGDAESAVAELRALGAPKDAVIYFAVDFDATPAQQTAINRYLQGAASVIGRSRVGVYGGYHVVKRCFDAKVITFGWQTYAWSGGLWDRRAQLQQYSNGHTLAGVSCDYDRATSASFGQFRIR